MKLIPTIAGALLGLLFLVFGLDHFLHFMPQPKMAMPEPVMDYFKLIGGSGYLTFVKLCEIVGGALVLVPLTRNIGMLLLGPVLVNIWCFHIFIAKWAMLKDPMGAGVVGLVTVLALIVLISGRKAWLGLLGR